MEASEGPECRSTRDSKVFSNEGALTKLSCESACLPRDGRIGVGGAVSKVGFDGWQKELAIRESRLEGGHRR